MHVPMLLVSLLCFFGISCEAATPEVCSKTQAAAAENAVDALSSWTDVFRAFTEYKQCDDGAIAEGLDDKIVSLLVKQWDTVATLAILTRLHPGFKHFVLKHIDTLMSPTDGEAIVTNSTTRCPAAARDICASLEAKARRPD